MTTFEPPALSVPQALPVPQARFQKRRPAGLPEAPEGRERLVFALPLAIGLVAMLVALATTLANETDGIMAPLLLLLALGQAAAVAVRRARTGALDRFGSFLAVLSILAAIVVLVLPVWMYGANVNGVVHRTVVSGPAMLVLGTCVVVVAVRRLTAASPSGQDLALIPVLSVPMILGLVGFVFVLGRIIVSGLRTFRLDMITTAWQQIPGTNDYQVGYLGNILGTFLLISLTLLIAILPGVGAGVFMSEYPGRVAAVINFCTTMLRAIAVSIVGAVAIGVVHLANGLNSDSFLSLLIRGAWDDGQRLQAQKGSFVMAAFFLAMIVMPVIARLTEEGLRSAPREMREGSVGLGATDGYGLRRILLPWAAPNILTALILAGAEAAGSLAVIMFMATTGEHGVNLFTSVTDLDFAVFAAKYGPRPYSYNADPRYQMVQYQSTAALLLLVLTVGLTLIAMALQRQFAKRYRGSITAA